MSFLTDQYDAYRRQHRENYKQQNPGTTDADANAYYDANKTTTQHGIDDGFGATVQDTFSQQEVAPHKADPAGFHYGGDPGFANAENDAFRNQGSAFINAGGSGAGQMQQEAYDGQQQARADAATLSDRGGYNQAAAQADALGYGQSGFQGAGLARSDASGYAAQGAQAQTRMGPRIDTTGADRYRDMADNARALGFDSRDQSQDARGLQMEDRGVQYDALGRVRNFYEQGPGASAAQAQLQMGAEKNMSGALALARSGRGAGVSANAERQAMFQNAATGQELNQQMGLLRAQEEDAWRGRQLQAMGLEQQGMGNIAQQDAGIRQGDFQLREGDMQVRAQDLQAQGMSFEQAQAQAQLEADQRARNDQMTVAMRQLQESARSRGADLGLSYDTLGETARGRGDQTMVSLDQLGVQRQGQGDDYSLGMRGLGNQYDLGMTGYGLDSQRLGQHALDQGLLGNMGYEGLNSANIMSARTANSGFDAQRDSANTGMVAGALGALAMFSDVRAKKDIKLEDVDDDQFGLEHAKTRKAEQQAQALGYESPYANIGKASNAAGAPDYFQYTPPVETPEAQQPEEDGGVMGGLSSMFKDYSMGLSDERSKERIQSLESELEQYRALGGDQGGESFDHRPARGYSYEYKEPNQPGAAPGRQYGPMAQDLLKSPATASTVKQAPNGQLAVDTSRLALVNTAALSQQQREQDELERQVQALRMASGY